MPHDIFISYVEEDSDIALQIALGLEQAGYTTWCYELDSYPGISYLIQTGKAIGQSKAVLFVVSPDSVSSNQVTREVVRAHESGKVFIPVLRDMTRQEFQKRQPEWLEAIGAATSVRIPQEGIAGIIDRIIEGLKSSGIQPVSKPDVTKIDRIHKALDEQRLNGITKKESELGYPAEPSRKIRRERSKRPLLVSLVFITVIALIVVIVFSVNGWFGRQSETIIPTSTPSPSPTSTAAPTPTSTSREDITIVSEFDAPGQSTQGLAWDGTHLWLADNSGYLFKVRTSGETLGAYRAPESTPEGLTWDGKTFWLFTTNFGYIYQFSIDESDAAPSAEIISFFKSPNEIIGGTNDGLEWDGNNIWYSDQYTVYQINTNGNVIASFASPDEISGLTWDGEFLWLAYQPSVGSTVVAKVDTEGTTLQSLSSPVGIDSFTWANDRLWAAERDFHSGGSRIYELELPAEVMK